MEEELSIDRTPEFPIAVETCLFFSPTKRISACTLWIPDCPCGRLFDHVEFGVGEDSQPGTLGEDIQNHRHAA